MTLIKLVRQFPYILLCYYNYTIKTSDYCWIAKKEKKYTEIRCSFTV